VSQSIYLPGEVLDSPAFRALPDRARMLYIYLRSYSDPNGKPVFPSHAALAERVGCSVRTVRRSLAELRTAGLIEPGEKRGEVAFIGTAAPQPREPEAADTVALLGEIGIAPAEAQDLIAKSPHATGRYITDVVAYVKRGAEVGVRSPRAVARYALMTGKVRITGTKAGPPKRPPVSAPAVILEERITDMSRDEWINSIPEHKRSAIGKGAPTLCCSTCGGSRYHQSAMLLAMGKNKWKCSACYPQSATVAAADCDVNEQLMLGV
jgi:hypothetical protein